MFTNAVAIKCIELLLYNTLGEKCAIPKGEWRLSYEATTQYINSKLCLDSTIVEPTTIQDVGYFAVIMLPLSQLILKSQSTPDHQKKFSRNLAQALASNQYGSFITFDMLHPLKKATENAINSEAIQSQYSNQYCSPAILIFQLDKYTSRPLIDEQFFLTHKYKRFENMKSTIEIFASCAYNFYQDQKEERSRKFVLGHKTVVCDSKTHNEEGGPIQRLQLNSECAQNLFPALATGDDGLYEMLHPILDALNADDVDYDDESCLETDEEMADSSSSDSSDYVIIYVNGPNSLPASEVSSGPVRTLSLGNNSLSLESDAESISDNLENHRPAILCSLEEEAQAISCIHSLPSETLDEYRSLNQATAQASVAEENFIGAIDIVTLASDMITPNAGGQSSLDFMCEIATSFYTQVMSERLSQLTTINQQ